MSVLGALVALFFGTQSQTINVILCNDEDGYNPKCGYQAGTDTSLRMKTDLDSSLTMILGPKGRVQV